MGFEIVETPAAKYYVVAENHLRRPKIPDIALDSVIIESIGDYSKLNEPRADRFMLNLDTAKTQTNRIDMGDISEKSYSFGKFVARLSAIIGTGYILVGANYPVSGYSVIGANAVMSLIGISLIRDGEFGPLRRAISRIYADVNRMHVGRKAADYRNAIIVEKAEKSIAPELTKKIGRKPVIGIVYGASHHGNIIKMLQNPKHRRRMLSAIPLSYRHPQVENICTLLYDGEKWKINHQNNAIKLPARRRWKRKVIAAGRLVRMKIKKSVMRMR